MSTVLNFKFKNGHRPVPSSETERRLKAAEAAYLDALYADLFAFKMQHAAASTWTRERIDTEICRDAHAHCGSRLAKKLQQRIRR